jgi:hypothetical protein
MAVSGRLRTALQWRLADMNAMRSSLRALLVAMLLLFATERQAMAYTDPGTGALIWQALVGGLVGFLFNRRRLNTWFKKKKDPKN